MGRGVPLLLALWLSGAGLAAPAPGPRANLDLLELPLDVLATIPVVSASMRPQPLRKAPATVRVITAQQIAERGYLSLDDALRDLPGIDSVHVQGAYPTIHAFRGSYGDENRRMLLLIDGIEDNSLNGGFEFGGPAYSLHDIERIEVIWGPASALYGANAFSGIINLISRRPGVEVLQYQRDAGSEAFRADRFAVEDKRGAWAASLSGATTASDGPRYGNLHPRYANAYIDDAWSLRGRLYHQGAGSETTLGVHGFDTAMGNGVFGNSPTAFLGLPPPGPGNPGLGGYYHGPLAGEAPGRWHPYSRTAFLEHRLTLSPVLRLQGRLLSRKTGLASDSYSYPFSPSQNRFNRFIGTHRSYRQSAELQGQYDLTGGGTLTGGAQYHHDDLERGFRAVNADPAVQTVDGVPVGNLGATFADRQAVTVDHGSVYAEYLRPTAWLGATTFTLGARYDRDSLYGEVLTPRLGLVNTPHPDWTVKLLYGTAFRAPTMFERYSASPVRLANPNLDPEQVRSTELSLGYHLGALALQLTGFDNRLDDVIVEGVPVGGGLFQVQNIGSARIQGAELTLDYQPGGTLKVFANLTWQEGEQNNGGQRTAIPNIARLKGNAGLDWRMANGGSIDLAANAVGRRSLATSNPLGRLPGYALLHLTVTSPLRWNDQLQFALAVRNLLDRDVSDPGIKQADGASFPPELEQPGRSAWLSLRFLLD